MRPGFAKAAQAETGRGELLASVDMLRSVSNRVLETHTRAIQIAGGVLMVGIGFFLVSGLWGGLLAQLQTSVAGFTPVL